MLKKGSSFDATFIQLDTVNINSFAEIDTKDVYEYHRICSYLFDNDGSLITIFSNARRVEIAKATQLRKSDRHLIYELDPKKKNEAAD